MRVLGARKEEEESGEVRGVHGGSAFKVGGFKG